MKRYQLHGQLGVGGMGAVYRATDRLTGQQVALKQVRLGPLAGSQFSDSDALRVALAHEFQVLASLRHPHIISVLDFGFDDDRQPFFTMTLLDQPQTILEAGQGRSVAARIDLLIQLLQALAYLHRRGIVHRDLKPGNVLMQERVQVLDFGLATEKPGESTLAGTLRYMAPEILQGAVATRASDLYAVGVLAYELLTGRHPYGELSFSEQMKAVLYDTPNLDALEQTVVLGEVRSTREADTVLIDGAEIPPGAPQLTPDMSRRGDLTTIIGRLLDKDPAARFPDANAVIAALCAAVGRRQPPETEAIRESFLQAAAFVGRQAELATLQEGLGACLEGYGSAWLVGGESGVGKSRLLEELRVRALVAGALVVRGQGVTGGGLPFQLWRGPLRRLALESDLDDMTAASLKTIIPDIEALLGRTIPDVPALDGAASQARLFLAVTTLLAAQPRPVVLIMEDLHWAWTSTGPGESLSLLRHVIEAEVPLMIVGSYRDDEREDVPSALPGTTVISLERLDETAIGALSASMLGEAGQQAPVVELLERETEGNVFFLVEVVRALAEEAGGLEDIGRATLPQRVVTGGIQRIVERRLSRVPVEARPFLQRAAVAGRRLDLALLGAMMAGQNLHPWLYQCAEAAVLEVQQDTWRFSHDRLREGVLAELAPDHLQTLHREVALALEAVHPDQAAVLLEHWRAAGRADKEIHYTALAAGEALRYNPLLARQMLERVLPRVQDADERRRLTGMLADACVAVSDYRTAARHYDACLRPDEESPRQADALLGLVWCAGLQGDLPTAEAYLAEVEPLCRRLGYQRGLAQALDGVAMGAMLRGDINMAQSASAEGLAIYRAIGDRQGEASVMQNLAAVATRRDQDEESAAILRQAIAISREIGDLYQLGVSLVNLAQSAADVAEQLAALEEARAVFEQLHNRRGLAATLSELAHVLLGQDQINAAWVHADRARRLFEQLGDRKNLAETLYVLGEVTLTDGDDATARDHFTAGLEICRAIPAVYGWVQHSIQLARLMPPAEARALLRDALEAARDDPVLLSQLFQASADLAERLGQAEHAASWRAADEGDDLDATLAAVKVWLAS